MKKEVSLGGVALALALAAYAAQAQTNYTIDWFTLDGGGGTSTNGQYSLSGTIGQPDAGGPMTNGQYSVTGGYWAVIGLVQTEGAPLLSIHATATNSVIVSWPYPSTGFQLQQNSALETTNWTGVTTSPVHVGDEWQVPVTPPSGNRFYRLKNP